MARDKRRSYGFSHAGGLVADRVRSAGSRRGFSETRLLTHWVDIVGPDLARIAAPVKVSYAKGGLGATLILGCSGAHGPELEMQLPRIRDRVNACYGYNAISRIRLTQDGTPGFAEPQAAYTPPKPRADPKAVAALDLENVKDTRLRDALENLTHNVLSRGQTR